MLLRPGHHGYLDLRNLAGVESIFPHFFQPDTNTYQIDITMLCPQGRSEADGLPSEFLSRMRTIEGDA